MELVANLCAMLLGIAFVAGYIAYIVMGIKFLIQDYAVAHACVDSSLWAYVLVGVIMSWSRLNGISNAKKQNNSDESDGTTMCASLICYALFEFGFAIWGGIELYEHACEALSQAQIWTFAKVTFALQLTSGCLMVCAPLFLVALMSCLDGKAERKRESQAFATVAAANAALDGRNPNPTPLVPVALAPDTQAHTNALEKA